MARPPAERVGSARQTVHVLRIQCLQFLKLSLLLFDEIPSPAVLLANQCRLPPSSGANSIQQAKQCSVHAYQT